METSSFLLLKSRIYEIPGQEDTALFEGFTQTRSLLTLGAQQWEGLLHVLAQWQFPEAWV